MKKILAITALLLCVVLLFSSCSLGLSTESIGNVVTSISEALFPEPTEPLNENYNGRQNYYYSSLDEEGKIEYTKIYNAYMNYENCKLRLTESELEDMFNCVLYDNPEIFWVDSTYSYTRYASGTLVEPDYRNTPEESKEITDKVTTAVAKKVAEAAGIQSDYGKEKFFHDYICINTVYDLTTYEASGDAAYSVFIDGKSICEGYSRAMKMLLDGAGIYNYLVVGNTENEDGTIDGHMWNVVSIEGELYHLDVTWDDNDGEYGDNGYLYFNMTDEDIRKDHFDIVPYDNNCTSKTYNYYNVNGTFFNSFNGFNSLVVPCARNVTKDLVVEMRFANDGDYANLKNRIENDNGFFDFVSDVIRTSGIKVRKDEVQYIYEDEFNYLCIIFLKG